VLGKKEIGSHLRHQKEKTGIEQYLSEMEACLQNIYFGLRPGRYAVLVIGDSVFKGETHKTAELVGEVAREVGFNEVGLAERDLHPTKRSFSSAARRLREEKLLVLRKPSQQETFTLFSPPYTLWSYEKELRKREADALLEGEISTGESNGELTVKASSLEADKIRRLTFTHGFEAPNYQKESTWQAILENGDAFNTDASRKDPKYATHGLHKYKGKFYPQLARSLFNLADLSPGHTIFDPFCGSGTVLLESYLNGFLGKGFELNPLAIKISKVKTSILQVDPYLVDKRIGEFIDRLDDISSDESNRDIFDEGVIEELDSWFPAPVVNKLGWALSAIDEISQPDIRELLEICVSSIVRKVSQQDPKDLRIRRRKPPIEDAPVKELLTKTVKKQRQRLHKFAKRSNGSPCKFGSAEVFDADSREISSYREVGLEAGAVDAVVTSPPYATALPYIDTDRLSILLLNGLKTKRRKSIERSLVGARNIRKSERREVDSRIELQDFEGISSGYARNLITKIYELNKDADVGFRRKNKAALLYRYYSDMNKVIDRLDQVVAPGGSIFIVIGNNKTTAGDEKEEVDIDSSRAFQEMGRAKNWGSVDVIPITVTQEDKKHNKNSITENDILWFKK